MRNDVRQTVRLGVDGTVGTGIGTARYRVANSVVGGVLGSLAPERHGGA